MHRGDPTQFVAGKMLGHGTYAEAYLGSLKNDTNHHIVMKHLKHATW